MANASSADGLVSLIGSTFNDQWVGYNESTTNRTALQSGANFLSGQRCAFFTFPGGTTTPTLPGSTSGYLITEVTPITSLTATWYTFGELVKLGTLDLNGGGGGSFTGAAALPTRTELGTSNALDSMLICEVNTALSATPGTFTVTGLDDSGNSVTSATITPANSSAIGSASIINPPSGSNAWRSLTAASTTGTGTGKMDFWGIIPISSHSAMPTVSITDDLVNNGRIIKIGASKTLGAFLWASQSASATKIYVNILGDQ